MLTKILLLIVITISSLFSSESVIIGALAFRSKAETLTEWKATVDYLNQKEPKYTFTILPLTYPEINEAVKNNKLDFVITNSGHYVYLEKKYHISRIATMMRYKNGQWLDRFGGVIFTRAERSDIKTLDDLRGKTIAAVDPDSLGGYAAQMNEFFYHGIDKDDLELHFTGMPHKKALEEVLNKKADVGFVRTDILEDMARQGALDLHQIKILHRQKSENFPYILSTSLYPEWPISRMPHTKKDISNKVVIALLQRIPHAKPQEGDFGWSSPLEYRDIHELFQTLRLPPYDKPEIFTFRDVWNKYGITIQTGLLITFAFLFLFGWMYRKNSFEKVYARSLLDVTPNPIVVTNGERLLNANKSMLSFLGYTTLEAFKSEHGCVCDFFEKGDIEGYLQPMMKDQRWINYILSHPKREHKAKMTINEKTTLFKVEVSTVEAQKQFRAIVVFTDISSMIKQSTTDALTQIANRLHFNLLFEHAYQSAQREKSPLSLIFFDIDHFKHVNDTFGHLAGDDVLRHIANLAKRMLRKSDLIARWGGEEFILLLPNTSESSAAEVAEILRATIESETFDVVGHISCSFGVSELRVNEGQDSLLQRVDDLLYRAKESGRNKVVMG
ncbi:MAG: diguanylate cyclase [Campylobacterales bacterium]|nr:diguanylate cyclase [Campylobacterales bacterium]